MPDGHIELIPPKRALRRHGRSLDVRPAWARWTRAPERLYTIGVEEELMLLRPSDHSLAQCGDRVLARLPVDLAEHTCPETHAAVIELTTGIHGEVAGATSEIAGLRSRMACELDALGLRAACAGTYPLAGASETRVSGAARYKAVATSMRSLAHREPTMALHVHIGVPDPEEAIRLLNGIRDVVPLLLALSANSPFSHGRDSGFASTRTAIFNAFPRTGTARRFAGYSDYVAAVDPLIASGAISDPSFLWWDMRLQPALGTVEVRVMDAQSTVAESAPLIALVQSLARLVLESQPQQRGIEPEVLAENSFLAARDGLDARLIDPERRRLVPVRALAGDLIASCRPHAAALGCAVELDQIQRLVEVNGADRQRAWAAAAGDLPSVISMLSDRFVQRPDRPDRFLHAGGPVPADVHSGYGKPLASRVRPTWRRAPTTK